VIGDLAGHPIAVYNHCMRILAAVTLLSGSVLAQNNAPALQFRGEQGSKHATIVAAPADVGGAAGAKVMLFVDVTPKPGIHVYAPGSKDYIPISIKLEPSASIKAGKLTYPKSEMMTFGDEKVPVFQKPFRLTQEVTLDKSAKSGASLNVAGTVHMQACDDRVCFPPENVPIKWNVSVK
jgi:DsbC/DsbD-like thiol-disulfide interchange protein